MVKMFWTAGWILACAGIVPAATTVVSVAVVPGDPVKVVYETTGDEAVATVSFSADGEAVDPAQAANVYGDVNKVVPAGTHEIFWPIPVEQTGPIGALTATVTVWPVDDPPDYVTFDLTTGQRRYYTSAAALPRGLGDDTYRTERIVMRRIPAAGVTWNMGSLITESGRVPDEKAGATEGVGAASEFFHKVTLTKDFYLAVFETTQWQNHLITNNLAFTECSNRTYWTTRPADRICFKHLRGHQWKAGDGRTTTCDCIVRRAQQMMDAQVDLPTEAQWEYACRAGTTGATWFLDNLPASNQDVPDYAAYVRYLYNGGGENGKAYTALETLTTAGGTARVGTYEPNPWGLYDMLGNVSEQVLDGYRHKDYGDNESWMPDKTAVSDPEGPAYASKWRVRRGGQWREDARWCRAALRQGSGGKSWDTINPFGFGYRLAWHFANPTGLTKDNSTYGTTVRPFVPPVSRASAAVSLACAGNMATALASVSVTRREKGVWLSDETAIVTTPPAFFIVIR